MNDRPASRVDWRQVLILVALMVPLTLLWRTWAVWPLKILVVFFHELSHGFAALLTGGTIDHIEVVPQQGGLCVTRGGNRFWTLSAGYLGSLLWGGLALLLASRTRRDRLLTVAMGGLILLATLAWIRPVFGFGFGFHLLAASIVLVIGIFLPPVVNDLFLKLFGLASCLYVIPDIWSDTIARSHLPSDARMLAEMTHIPTVVWGGFWIVVAVALAALFLAKSCRTRPAQVPPPAAGGEPRVPPRGGRI